MVRVRGELVLNQGGLDKAESNLRESIALAHQMGAKAWELRSTMSLTRLLASKHRPDEASTMLARNLELVQ
ncbi:MAG TPA: hypothetical protein VJ728_04800 [Candidatus Binataceae bacterium]|nr:hypothetical protein [Candidatus Binataceae bacterium]